MQALWSHMFYCFTTNVLLNSFWGRTSPSNVGLTAWKTPCCLKKQKEENVVFWVERNLHWGPELFLSVVNWSNGTFYTLWNSLTWHKKASMSSEIGEKVSQVKLLVKWNCSFKTSLKMYLKTPNAGKDRSKSIFLFLSAHVYFYRRTVFCLLNLSFSVKFAEHTLRGKKMRGKIHRTFTFWNFTDSS